VICVDKIPAKIEKLEYRAYRPIYEPRPLNDAAWPRMSLQGRIVFPHAADLKKAVDGADWRGFRRRHTDAAGTVMPIDLCHGGPLKKSQPTYRYAVLVTKNRTVPPVGTKPPGPKQVVSKAQPKAEFDVASKPRNSGAKGRDR